MQSFLEFIIPMFRNCSTCFGRQTTHHQELKNCNYSLWFYIRLWLPVAATGNHKRPCVLLYIITFQNNFCRVSVLSDSHSPSLRTAFGRSVEWGMLIRQTSRKKWQPIRSCPIKNNALFRCLFCFSPLTSIEITSLPQEVDCRLLNQSCRWD